MSARGEAAVRPEDEVVDLCRDLLRIDTSNYGDGSGPGERKAAEHVMTLLDDVGVQGELVESAPGRASVVVRLEGEDSSRPALMVHGHLDVVPADAADWQLPPFAGEERDGCLWGRGAVDMKDMDAMMLAVVRDLARTRQRPPRDVVVAWLADEEAGGLQGSHWLVDHRRDLVDGVGEAVSEVGGFSATIEGQRFYLLQTAEKGIAWLRLKARGRAGHGSQVHDDNAVVHLAEALARIGAYRWPVEVIPTVRALLDGVADATGLRVDPRDPASLAGLGSVGRFVAATFQDTANPTGLTAGYKHNVVPGSAEALLDCRFLPGHEDELMATIDDLAGDRVEVSVVHRDVSLEVPFEGRLVDAMVAALRSQDADARVLPYCLSGGTDNKALSLLGITGYGFAPLQLPADLDFAGMFHGVDERVPVDSLRFGTRVLAEFLRTC